MNNIIKKYTILNILYSYGYMSNSWADSDNIKLTAIIITLVKLKIGNKIKFQENKNSAGPSSMPENLTENFQNIQTQKRDQDTQKGLWKHLHLTVTL